MNANGDGAKYWKSDDVGILTTTPPKDETMASPWPDVIAGILADWVGIFPIFKMGLLTCGIR